MTKNGQKWQEMAKNGTCDGLIVTKPVLNDFSSSKTPKLIPNIDIYEIIFFALFWHRSGTKVAENGTSPPGKFWKTYMVFTEALMKIFQLRNL